ncbi:hypothetical protein JW826_00350 [Candidatus Woesearchaeota archaeon]|nr:hypothetical protein [Candidatus Woesearchaeota archaeon]
MINIPLSQIKEKISQKAGLSEEEINAKIKDKLKQLSGLISEEGAAHIIANELGVKLFTPGEALQVKSVLSGMRNVDLNAKVLQIYETREFVTARGPGKVSNILVGDETGIIRVVMWNKQAENVGQLKEGDVLKIVGGYVRENQGRKEIHMNDLSKLIINPAGLVVNVAERGSAAAQKEYVRKKIAEISEMDSAVQVLATIVQVFDINFFEVCPQCNKRARLREDGFVCQSHGKVSPTYNYVLNIYADDGSDNVRVVLWREQVEQLLGMNRDQVLGFKEDPAMFESVKHDLLGNIVLIDGRANKNQTFDRIELVASKINKNPDPEEETARLKEEAAKQPAKQAEKPIPAPVKAPEAKPEQAKTAHNPESAPAKAADQEFEEMNLEEELVDLEDL